MTLVGSLVSLDHSWEMLVGSSASLDHSWVTLVGSLASLDYSCESRGVGMVTRHESWETRRGRLERCEDLARWVGRR